MDSAESDGKVDHPTEEELWQMERADIHSNARVRRRDDCRVCGRRCPETDYSKKYAAAGGRLSGPFCGSDCFWRFFNDDSPDGVSV